MTGPLISEAYRQLQADLHASNPTYGKASVTYAREVAALIQQSDAKELLEYGAGKGRLGETLKTLLAYPPTIHHYEPAIPEWAAAPEPCEMVACIDVLEHIEPDYLDAVLDDLKRVTLRLGFISVHCLPARRVLADGRNAHLTQQPPEWWLPKITQRFDLYQFLRQDSGFWVIVEPQGQRRADAPTSVES